MGTVSKPFYWLICDRCGGKSTEGSDYVAWSEEDQARDEADEAGWLILSVGDYCEHCWFWDDDDRQVVKPQAIAALDGGERIRTIPVPVTPDAYPQRVRAPAALDGESGE